MPNGNIDTAYYEDGSYPISRTIERDTSPTLRLLLSALKRPWVVTITVFLIFIPVLFYIYSQVPLYRSTAIISVDIETRNPFSQMVSGGIPIESSGAAEEYYLSILQSKTFYRNVANHILAEMPYLRADSVYSIINGLISFDRKPRAPGFINIHSTARTPEMALLVAHKSLISFQDISVELRRSDANRVVQFIENQLVQLNDNLGAIENEMQIFFQERRLTIDDVASGIDSELRTLERGLAEAQASRDLANLQVSSYADQINKRLLEYFEGKSSDVHRQKVDEFRREVDKINRILDTISSETGDSIIYLQYQNERRQLLAQMIQAMNQEQVGSASLSQTQQVSLKTVEKELENWLMEYDKAQVKCMFYETAIKNFMGSHPNLSSDILEYLNISRSKAVLQKTIDILVEQRERMRIKTASEGGGIKILDKPNLPDKPISQRRALKLSVALLFALFAGFGLAYVMDLFDNSVQNEKEIQTRFNLPVYGSVPVLSAARAFSRRRSRRGRHSSQRADNNGLVNITQLDYYSESSPVAEAYRSIKTAILFTARDKQKKVFILSSPIAGDGKSLTSYNLCISLAQGGHRTLLIDADLRRSNQHKLFAVERSPGLTDRLLGDASTKEVIRPHSSLGNFFVITAGKKISNPAELLSSHTMKEFIDEISPAFDIILVDTPPITPCMDSRHLGILSGGLILIVRAESTKLNVIEHSVNLCKRVDVEILGVIVNHASFRYGYGYYYVYQRNNPYGYYYSGYQYYYTTDSESGEKVRKKRRKKKTQHSYEVGD